MPAKPLYERLGGAEAITALIGDIVDLHRENPLIGSRFASIDVAKVKKLSTDFFCAGSGGPECYGGRDVRTVHTGMNISEEEFRAALDDISKAMNKRGIAKPEQDEILAILNSMKADVVGV